MTSPLVPLISLPPVGPKNKEEGEDKIFFSVCNQTLTGKNDVIVAIYDANMEIDIAANVSTMRRTIIGCISFSYEMP